MFPLRRVSGPDAQIRTPGPLWRPLVFQSQGSLPAPRRQTGGGRGHETKMQPLLWWCLMCSMCLICLMCLMTANGVEGTQNAAARLISWLDGFHRRDPGRSRPFKAVQGRARLSKAIDFPSATNSFARETYAMN